MENKELAEQLRIAAEILETGKEWEWRGVDNTWWNPTHSLLFHVSSSHEIRIKPWSLPKPPEGEQWHSEDYWKEGMLENGERPLLEGEVIKQGDLYFHEDKWLLSNSYMPVRIGYHHPHKTSRPLPQKKTKKIVPLGPEDVPMGSYLRFKTAPDCSWRSIIGLSKNGVASVEMMSDNATRIKFCLWEELKESYLIKRPTDADFVPAHKEIEE